MTSGWVRSELGPFRLDVSWETVPGKVLVLFGPSGSGKTVTLRCIAGLHTPREGHIDIGGATVFDHSLHINVAPHHRRVGYVPQDLLLFPHLDVAGNVGYGLRGQSAESRRKRVDGLLAGVGLEGFGTRRPWELSGGQQQRVALARALAPGPSVLLLDEPFSALDLDTRRQVRAEVHEALRGAQIPVVLVTHDREDAFAMGDQVLVLDGGTTIASGVPVEVLGHPPRERVARLMGVENLLHLRVDQVAPSEGTMTCSGGQFVLEVPLSDARVGDEVTVGLRADDILLASSVPAGLSARNVLPGNVASVEPAGALWQVTVDCGVLIRSHVTRGAVANLGIVPGAKVWVVIKASSCVVMR